MPSVGSYQAKTHLPKLLQRVKNGEKITITLRGIPIALLSPPEQSPRHNVRDAIRRMRALRKGNKLGKDLTIRDLIEEGRRY